jgi:hypothetical protein
MTIIEATFYPCLIDKRDDILDFDTNRTDKIKQANNMAMEMIKYIGNVKKYKPFKDKYDNIKATIECSEQSKEDIKRKLIDYFGGRDYVGPLAEESWLDREDIFFDEREGIFYFGIYFNSFEICYDD